MSFLVIDTSTERGILAYGSSKNILFKQEFPLGLNQSKRLLPALEEALRPYNFFPELTAIGVGMGPGSYTGIRIGVAVAQALAYSWKVPLIGFSSLEGFIPSELSVHFAAILDARIGGVYFQRGRKLQAEVQFEDQPQICPLEEVGSYLKEVTYLVSPMISSLQTKLSKLYPQSKWLWEERTSSVRMLLQNVERRFLKGEAVISPQHLKLLYLRQTEAERERLLQKER